MLASATATSLTMRIRVACNRAFFLTQVRCFFFIFGLPTRCMRAETVLDSEHTGQKVALQSCAKLSLKLRKKP